MQEKKPFNDVNDYVQKHIGIPEKAEIKKLPRLLKWVGYLLGTFVFLTFLLGLLLVFFN